MTLLYLKKNIKSNRIIAALSNKLLIPKRKTYSSDFLSTLKKASTT